jgi:hypothetical protein
MRFIPFERVVLHSVLPPDQLAERLAAIVDRPSRVLGLMARAAKPFQGSVDGRVFKVWPSPLIHNVFRPVICGVIRSADAGSSVTVVMRLSYGVTAVLAVGLLNCALMAAGYAWSGPPPLREERMVAAFFPIVAYILSTVVFRFGARGALRNLAALDAAPLHDVAGLTSRATAGSSHR